MSVNRRQIEADRTSSWALPYHDIEHEIFQCGIEDLFDHAIQTMNLIDEEHIALFEVGKDRRKIACALDSRARW